VHSKPSGRNIWPKTADGVSTKTGEQAVLHAYRVLPDAAQHCSATKQASPLIPMWIMRCPCFMCVCMSFPLSPCSWKTSSTRLCAQVQIEEKGHDEGVQEMGRSGRKERHRKVVQCHEEVLFGHSCARAYPGTYWAILLD
jgi:hypothetical protein